MDSGLTFGVRSKSNHEIFHVVIHKSTVSVKL